MSATDPHTTPPPASPPTSVAAGDLDEYEIDGNTFLLTAEDAKRRGAKAVTPRNKAGKPENK